MKNIKNLTNYLTDWLNDDWWSIKLTNSMKQILRSLSVQEILQGIRNA